MPCFYVQLPGFGTAFVRVQMPPHKKCPFCGKREATQLCDFPVGNGKTCDAPICKSCATVVGPDRDHCPKHKSAPMQGGLF